MFGAKIIIRLIGLIFIFCPIAVSGQLYINEIQAANQSTIVDADFDAYSDWIELYNDTAVEIDISNYYLTDNVEEPQKWKIPEGTFVPGNGYLVIWADSENTNLHSNFKLKKSGEHIFLLNSAEDIIDELNFPEQPTDLSFGRITDGDEELVYFESASPGTSNGGVSFDTITPYNVDFSISGGIYESQQNLELNSNAGNIYFTKDGSLPNQNSLRYEGPININYSQVIRARVIVSGEYPGDIFTHSFLIDESLDERQISVISLATNPDHFWDTDIGLYMQDFKPLAEYPVNIEFFENDGDNHAAFNEAAGVKINGNNSWQFPQKILGIYFKDKYGKPELEYPVFPERARKSFDYLALRASGNDQGSTLIRDGLFQSIVGENMDFELQGFRPAAVFVNGEYIGLHNIRSKQNEAYFEHFFDVENGNYDLILNNGEVDEGDDVDFQLLMNLFSQDLSNESNFALLEEVMDMENMIQFFIAELWASNRSWGHNIKLWKPKTQGGKWRWVLKDVDRGFYGADNNGINYFIDAGISPSGYEWARVVLRSLLQNEKFSASFFKKFADHLFVTFHHNRVATFIEEKANNIEKEIPFHLSVWGGVTADYGDALPSLEHWYNEILDLESFAIDRSVYLREDFTETTTVSPLVNLGLICHPKGAGTIQFNQLNVPLSNWTGKYNKNVPIDLNVDVKVGHQFLGWSKGSFEKAIPFGDTWKYWDLDSYPGSGWTEANYNDNSWKTGNAMFGYGEDEVITQVEFGGDEDNKYPTTYFRKKFTINNLEHFTGQIILNIIRDDGVIIYLNGKEIKRVDMPAGQIDYNTLAYHTIADELENAGQFIINSTELLLGENIISVEIHQRTLGSSDLSFDLELLLLELGEDPLFSSIESIAVSLSSDSVLVANFEASSNCILPEIIDEHTTLNIDCSPYWATADIKILPETTLTIDAGVEILMPENASLIVAGNLNINGTALEPVEIKNNSLDGHESWGQIRFENSTDLSEIHYLNLKNPTKGVHPIRDDAAISIFYGDLILDHVNVQNAENALIIGYYANLNLSNSLLQVNDDKDMVKLKYGTANIFNNEFKGNHKKGTYGLRLTEMESIAVNQNKFFDFFGKNSHALDITDSKFCYVLNNLIHNITDKGISVGKNSEVTIENNTIVNCGEGIGVKDGGNILVDQNTFYNNTTHIKLFEKESGEGSGLGTIRNCIFSNAVDDAILSDAGTQVNINYCIFDEPSTSSGSNIFGDPKFVNPNRNDFRLGIGSPAINGGVSNGGAVNIGTDSHKFTAPPSILISAIHYYPQEEQDEEFIEIVNIGESSIDLSGFEIDGAISMTFANDVGLMPGESLRIAKNAMLHTNAGLNVVQWDSGKLNDEGETIILTDSYGIVQDHVQYKNVSPWPTNAAGEGSALYLKSNDLDNHFGGNWEAILISDIENIESTAGGFIIAPNPTSETIFIKSSNDEINNVEMFNVLGVSLFNQQYLKNIRNLELDISNLIAGIYYIKINKKELIPIVIN